jgi:hypothetical protein
MFYPDHAPPHFHPEYGSEKAMIDIETLTVVDGKLPSRALGLVVEWASLHQEELLELWKLALEKKPLSKIAPLE